MKSSIFFITFLIQSFLIGQNISESLPDLELNSQKYVESIETDTILVSFSMFGTSLSLKGADNERIVSLYCETQIPNSVNFECPNTVSIFYNGIKEKASLFESASFDLSFFDSTHFTNSEKMFNIKINESPIDSIYQSELMLISNEGCYIEIINYKTIDYLNLRLKEYFDELGTVYLIIKHLTFYKDGVLFEIPEFIGFRIN